MGNNPISQLELTQLVSGFIEKGLKSSDEESFNSLALQEFLYQYNENEVYRQYCNALNISPAMVQRWSEIPALPTKAFKESIVASFPLNETELSLLTSGTTNPDARGKIYRDKDSLTLIKRANYLLTKEFLFPDIDRIHILLLVPSPKVAPGMPMAYGLEQARIEFGTDKSAYYISPKGLLIDELVTALRDAEKSHEPVCLMGATSGFVYLFNHCRALSLTFRLAAGSRVCDGGGYQGTFGQCTREQYYQLVHDFLGVPESHCVNTLGMGESGTNYFDNVLRDCHGNVKPVGRHKVDLPWTRTIVVGIRTGQRLPAGELGLIRHYDLTNIATVIGVQTDNIGYETEEGFEILGRSVNLPGYQLEKPGGAVKDWILGVGKHISPR